MNRTVELGQKIPYGAMDFQLDVSRHTYFVGNPGRSGASFPVCIKAGVYCSETEVLNLVAEVQPSTKAHDAGYIFKYEPGIGPDEPDRILGYMGSNPKAEPIAELAYTSEGAYLVDHEAQVAYEHQRRGLATAMYQRAEALTGKQFLSRQGEPIPMDGAAFWASPERAFGVDALYSHPKRLLWVNLADLLPAALSELPCVHFDADRFTASATGQRGIEMINTGNGPRTGLQEARMRGLVAHGQAGVVDSFVADPQAVLKRVRRVLCSAQPPTLALSNNRGLPDMSISPGLAALTYESREEVLQFVGRYLHALADLDAMEILHAQIKALCRVRIVRHERGDPGGIERAFVAHREQAVSVLTDLLEQEAEFRASQM
ncbi:MAG: hypothetical protein Q7U28_05620 [Aquabacterium sp.]|nr:hypothetical protein [Aquabacterium sp.]